MHAVNIIVPPPHAGVDHPQTSDRIMAAVRAVLIRHGFTRTFSEGLVERWAWRDEDKPPGLHVTITNARSGLDVRLAQDLYGVRNRIPKFEAVFDELNLAIAQCAGVDHVQTRTIGELRPQDVQEDRVAADDGPVRSAAVQATMRH
jgi:hypothetical protein